MTTREAHVTTPLGAWSRITALAEAMRPKQWVKNLLVVAAPAAGGELTHPPTPARTALAFVAFCLAASGTYLLNDLADSEADRLHPVKRNRAIASGRVPRPLALVTGLVLLVAALLVGLPLDERFVLIVGVYIALTLSYTVWLKKVAVLDIALVASFYVMRALAGGAATHVHLSPWFLAATSSLSMFVVAGKRHADHLLMESQGAVTEPTDALYTLPFLRYIWMMSSGLAIGSYALWAFEMPHVHQGVAWGEVSIAAFALGVLRYALLIERGDGGAPEEILTRDRPLQVIGLVWMILYGLGVYLHG